MRAVATALAKAQRKNLRNRAITVNKARSDALNECNIRLIPVRNERGRMQNILGALKNAPVLIAGDAPELFKQGTMLNLELSGGHVVFDIDLHAQPRKPDCRSVRGTSPRPPGYRIAWKFWHTPVTPSA